LIQTRIKHRQPEAHRALCGVGLDILDHLDPGLAEFLYQLNASAFFITKPERPFCRHKVAFRKETATVRLWFNTF